MVAYNTPVNSSDNASTFTIPYTHTGSNGLLMVMVSLIPDNDQEVSGVVCGGVPLTNRIIVQTRQDIRVELWYMIAPSEGTSEIVVTLSDIAKTIVNVFSITGVNQTNPLYFNTTVSGTQVTVIPFSIQEKAGNGILGLGATDSLAQAYVFTELGQTELFNVSYNNEMRTQAVYANSTQTGTLSIANFLNMPSNWALILFNIEAS